jgi:hypothetical protein
MAGQAGNYYKLILFYKNVYKLTQLARMWQEKRSWCTQSAHTFFPLCRRRPLLSSTVDLESFSPKTVRERASTVKPEPNGFTSLSRYIHNVHEIPVEVLKRRNQ